MNEAMKSIKSLLIRTGKAAIQLRSIPDKQLRPVLLKLADAVEENSAAILKANQKDLAAQDPGNIGTILRTCDAVGVSGLILLANSADPYDPSAVRASMGAIFTQRLVRATWNDFVAWKKAHAVPLVGTSGGAAQDYQRVAFPAPMVLLMGSEREGLSPTQQAACDLLVRIPMVGHSDSLNLAIATAVVLYEAFDQKRSAISAQHSA